MPVDAPCFVSEAALTEQDCIFCELGRGGIPADKLYDDGAVFAVRDIAPKAPLHVLVIPHAHVGALADAPTELAEAAVRCMAAAPGIARDQGAADAGYRLVVNQGPDSGQDVPHFHLHIIGGRQLGAMG